MDSHQDTILIKDFLLGKLSPVQQAAFELRLNNDPEFESEFRFHQALFAEFERKEFLDLKKMLQKEELTYQKKPRNKWPMVAFFILLVFGISYWATREYTHETIPNNLEQNIPSDNPRTPPLKNQDTLAAKNTPSVAPETLAGALRFQPNNAFEAQISSMTRSFQTDSLSLLSPDYNARYTTRQSRRLVFKGVLYSKLEEKELLLSLFNNRDPKPVFEHLLPLKAGSQENRFEKSLALSLAPGLYYYTLEMTTQGTVLHTGKLTVYD
ncbi:MAG: hypothetical protein H7246_09410 [Phycisphaerae bacterium]|nr:hypothetical protein [Saprospiraceae bacterium]